MLRNLLDRLEFLIRLQRFCLLFALLSCAVTASAEESVCFGTTANGRLEHGVRLPLSGENFSAYSFLGWSLGRTFVHTKVRRTVVKTFAALETAAPGKVFVYGETGWESGGRMKPHKTHRNGLSLDMMVPVLRDGESVPLPGGLYNRYGYDIEFDNDGRYGAYTIDFEAMGELLYQLHRAAKAQRIGIARVIFEVPLQRHLWRTRRGAYLRANIAFSTRPAWVKHDEHFHVDFQTACRPL